MNRITRGEALCSMVTNVLGQEVVDGLHGENYYLSGFVRTAEEVELLKELGHNKILSIAIPGGHPAELRLGVNSLFAVFRQLPAIKTVEIQVDTSVQEDMFSFESQHVA